MPRHERLLKHYISFIDLLSHQAGHTVELLINELVLQQLLKDSDSIHDVQSFGTRNEDSSTLITAYLVYHTRAWLQDTLGDTILEIERAAAELGPCSVTAGFTNPVHQQRLTKLFRDIWNCLTVGKERYPRKAQVFFKQLHEVARQSGIADHMPAEYPLHRLLKESARRHVVFRFLAGTVLTRPYSVGLTQSVPNSAMSTWLKHISRGLQGFLDRIDRRSTPFEEFLFDFGQSHDGGRREFVSIITGEAIADTAASSDEHALPEQDAQVPAYSAALVAFDLQNVTHSLEGRSGLAGLISILRPILNCCIQVLNGTAEDMTPPRSTASQQPVLAAAAAAHADRASQSTIGAGIGRSLITPEDFERVADEFERPLALMEDEDDTSRLTTRQPSEQTESSADTALHGSLPPVPDHVLPSPFDLREHTAEATMGPAYESLQRRFFRLKQHSQTVSDRFRQLTKVNRSAVAYIRVLTDFIEQQNLTPPDPQPIEESERDLLPGDDDWTDLEDSSASRPHSVDAASSGRSACGPPVASDSVARGFTRPFARRSRTNIRIMRPATLPRRTLATGREDEANASANTKPAEAASDAIGLDHEQQEAGNKNMEDASSSQSSSNSSGKGKSKTIKSSTV
eukprot:TRINITY_DN7943_c0_g1_i3.p1 TRINITY_DN7943_c0_g1~~TRINITY_DN7943_c0_g1_i3.p1  ORF type:complete len:628 (+),score=105.47 TRINITY_DN7943_c0_g1_i3:61-1944(+)